MIQIGRPPRLKGAFVLVWSRRLDSAVMLHFPEPEAWVVATLLNPISPLLPASRQETPGYKVDSLSRRIEHENSSLYDDE